MENLSVIDMTLLVVFVAFAAFVFTMIVMYCAKNVHESRERDKEWSRVISIDDGSTVAPEELAADIDIAPDYWLSAEGVVHNSLCRWYEKCDGMAWDGSEGEYKDCGLCGGQHPIVRLWNIPEWKAVHSDKS